MVVDPTPMRSKAGTGLKWTSFGLRRPEHLMHQEFTPHTTLLPPDGPLLRTERHVFIKTVFQQVYSLSQEVILSWKINEAAWLQLISNGTPAYRKRSDPPDLESKIQQGLTWISKVNLQISRSSFWFPIPPQGWRASWETWQIIWSQNVRELLTWGGKRKVPYFPAEIWATLHDIWRWLLSSRWRDPRKSTCTRISFIAIGNKSEL